jgi:NADPH-dependent 2,4-dienoyl-CoA reductase/sulfur reductase-like enzyme
MLDHVVVVGASLAGLRAMETLRAEGFTGRITAIGDEPHLPYDRPPLSKQFLAGDWDADRIALRKPDAMESLGVEWRLGGRASALDLAAREVLLADGGAVRYDGLVLATGSTPRLLPGQPDAAGVHVLRTLDDSIALRADVAVAGRRLVVIGAGFIGLEVAASARKLGAEVVVLEGLPAPLIRALGPEMGRAVAGVHGRNGVEIRCDLRVESIEVTDGRATGVRLADGEVVPADAVLVGIGAAPATGWLAGSGLAIGEGPGKDGVWCDATLNAGADPSPGSVFAAGDIARWDLHGEMVRLEHWTNAAEQGAAAARNLLRRAAGEPAEPYVPVPFVWSDQYDSRIQLLGHPGVADEVEVVAGNIDEGKFAALYHAGDRLTGVLGVSMPKAVMPVRKLLAAGATFTEARATFQ